MNRRMITIIVIACLAVAIVAIAGCSGGSTTSTTGGSATSGGATTPKTIKVTAADNGSTQQAAVGDTLEVTLDANPTTGYEWAVDGELPPVLKADGEPSYTTTAPAGVAGAGGASTIKYSVVKAGDGELKLKYWRTFEATVPPVATFAVTVQAK